jgi:hypothetical protein
MKRREFLVSSLALCAGAKTGLARAAGAAKTPPAPLRFAEHPDSETAAAPTAAEALTKSLRLRPFFVPFISAFIE